MEFHQVCTDFLFRALFKHSQHHTAGRLATVIISIAKAGKMRCRLRAWSVPVELGFSSAFRDWQHQSLCSVQVLLRVQHSSWKSRFTSLRTDQIQTAWPSWHPLLYSLLCGLADTGPISHTAPCSAHVLHSFIMTLGSVHLSCNWDRNASSVRD